MLTVEQPIIFPIYHEYYSNISLLWSSAVNQVQDMRQEIESVRFVQNDQVVFESVWNRNVEMSVRFSNIFADLNSTHSFLRVRRIFKS